MFGEISAGSCAFFFHKHKFVEDLEDFLIDRIEMYLTCVLGGDMGLASVGCDVVE